MQSLGLFENDDGSPVRLRRNGRQPKAVGLYFSVKSGLHLPYESKLVLHDLWRAEVCTEVLESRPQPFTMRFMLDGEVHRYTPDRKDLRAGGVVEIVEVKDDGEGEGELHDVVRSLLADRGMAFHVRRRAQIEAEPSFTAVETVQRNRRTRILVWDMLSVRLLLASGPAPLSEALGVLAPGAAGLATACAPCRRQGRPCRKPPAKPPEHRLDRRISQAVAEHGPNQLADRISPTPGRRRPKRRPQPIEDRGQPRRRAWEWERLHRTATKRT